MKRVLIVGNLNDDKWIGALIRNVKAYNPNIIIDVFNSDYEDKHTNKSISLCDNIIGIEHKFPVFLYKLRIIRNIFYYLDMFLSFKSWTNKCIQNNIHYNVLNIHFVKQEILSVWKLYRKIADKLIITPWGSDILRASNSSLFFSRLYTRHYDCITTTENERFNEQIKKAIGNNNIEYKHVDFGSEVIDNLIERLYIDKNQAKKELGLDDLFVIEIGYNGNPAQNHKKVIDALYTAKKHLPSNLCIVLPMTYALKKDYETEVTQQLKEYGFRYKLYTKYLSVDEIFYLRRCCDIFIHAQQSDANSASLAEYMICGTTIINGSWLNYENREIYGKPYYEFSEYNDLSHTIVNAYLNGSLISENLVEDMKKLGWKYWSAKWCELFENIS